AAMRKVGIDPNKASDVTIVKQPFDMSLLLNGEVDAAQAMIYNEYAQVLEQKNPKTGKLYQPDELNVIDFNEVGTAMLQDHLFARDAWLKKSGNEDIATRFLQASFKGWVFCRDSQKECVDIVLKAGTTLGKGHMTWQLNEINALIWPSPSGIGAIATKNQGDPAAIAKDTSEHVLVSWSAQAGLKPLVITGGQGSWLHAGERRILDFSSGLINVNLGHGYPSVVRAIQEQAEKVCYVTPSFAEESRAKLARLLAEVTPGDLSKTIFTTGGSEANEHAIKIARLYTRRHKILTQWRSFHGQSQGSMTLGGDNRRWPAEPGITGVVHFLNPDPYRSVFGGDVQKALAHVEEVIWYEGPEYVAAIMVEPIPG